MRQKFGIWMKVVCRRFKNHARL